MQKCEICQQMTNDLVEHRMTDDGQLMVDYICLDCQKLFDKFEPVEVWSFEKAVQRAG